MVVKCSGPMRRVYTADVTDGYICTEGLASPSFDSPFAERADYPFISFLKVGEVPFDVTNGGRVSVGASGDEGSLAAIRVDSIYDSMAFLVVPWDVPGERIGAWKKYSVFGEFKVTEGDDVLQNASLFYLEKGFAVDGGSIDAWSVVAPLQIRQRLFDWMSNFDMIYINNGAKLGGSRRNLGEFLGNTDFRGLSSALTCRLEKRFNDEFFPSSYGK